MSATLQQAPPTPRPRRRFAFLVKPGWWGAIAGALAFTAACWLILAPWQFGRNTETSQTNAGIDAALHATPLPVDQRLSTTGQPAEQSIWQPVTATGTFLPGREYYVRLRQDDGGNPVSEIVLPMQLTDGTVLLVDRGTRSILDIGKGFQLPPVPAGVVTVTGRVQQDQTDPRHRQPGLLNGLNQAYAVNSHDLAGAVATAGNLRQGYIQLMAGSPSVLDEIGMPQTDSGPYLSYALQWCAFGAMSLLAIGYFIFREATDPRGPDERNVPYPARGRLDDDEDDAERGLGHGQDGPSRYDGPAASTRAQSTPAPPGSTTAGSTPAGSTPVGDTPAGSAPAGYTPAGYTPAGTTSAGYTPAGTTSAGYTPAGDTAPATAVPAATTAVPARTSKKRRPARDGFDRSELFD